MKKLMTVIFVFVLILSQFANALSWDATVAENLSKRHANKLNEKMEERVEALENSMSERIVRLNERLMKEIKALKGKVEEQESKIKALTEAVDTLKKQIPKTETTSDSNGKQKLIRVEMRNGRGEIVKTVLWDGKGEFPTPDNSVGIVAPNRIRIEE